MCLYLFVLMFDSQLFSYKFMNEVYVLFSYIYIETLLQFAHHRDCTIILLAFEKSIIL